MARTDTVRRRGYRTLLLAADSGMAVADAAVRFAMPVMVAAAMLCLRIFVGGGINRWEGGPWSHWRS